MSQNVWKREEDSYVREFLLDLPPAANFMYREANNMYAMLEPSALFWPVLDEGEFQSHDVIVLGDPETRQYVLAGAVTAHRSLTYFSLVKRGRRMHSIRMVQPDIRENDTPEEVVVLKGSDWRKLLLEYAHITAKKMGVNPIRPEKNLTGYCSWYYYYADVTEQNFLENLASLQSNRSPYAAHVAQIDDGYQTFQGDWNDQHSDWPTPLSDIAARIEGTGMQAGIWLMPFVASTASRVYREHPDWFVQTSDGTAQVAQGWSPPPDHLWACLDTTQDEVIEHLVQIFKTFRKWGYSYFKLDGLSFGLMLGRRKDPAATPVSAFRRAMKAIREAVPDSFILGCCPPYMACLGYIDAARISADTHASHHGILNAYYSGIRRWWSYDILYRADPDVVITRQDRATQTEGVSRISAMTGILSGISITSDNLGTLDPDRLALLGRTQKYRLHDILPVDWNLGAWPQKFTGRIDGVNGAAVINNTDKEMTFAFEELELPGVAEELLHPMGRLSGSITLQPFDAALLRAAE